MPKDYHDDTKCQIEFPANHLMSFASRTPIQKIDETRNSYVEQTMMSMFRLTWRGESMRINNNLACLAFNGPFRTRRVPKATPHISFFDVKLEELTVFRLSKEGDNRNFGTKSMSDPPHNTTSGTAARSNKNYDSWEEDPTTNKKARITIIRAHHAQKHTQDTMDTQTKNTQNTQNTFEARKTRRTS